MLQMVYCIDTEMVISKVFPVAKFKYMQMTMDIQKSYLWVKYLVFVSRFCHEAFSALSTIRMAFYREKKLMSFKCRVNSVYFP
jgi:hypothetical protein